MATHLNLNWISNLQYPFQFICWLDWWQLIELIENLIWRWQTQLELFNPSYQFLESLLICQIWAKLYYLISLSRHLASNVFLLVTTILFLQPTKISSDVHFSQETRTGWQPAGDISIKSQSWDERVNVYKYPDNSFFPADSWSMVPLSPGSHRAWSGSLLSFLSFSHDWVDR